MNYHQIIEQHAPGGKSTAAGDLHEELWECLLRREDPRFHNVRITRGDGGIDGIVFVDPVTAKCHVYQAKFFPELKDDKGTRKASIVGAFVRAMKHQFECVQWILLLPRELSCADLNWLTSELRAEAIKVLDAEGPSSAVALARGRACGIDYKDGKDLGRMLRANLDIAGRLLPESHLALVQAVNEERQKRAQDRTDLNDKLEIMKEEAIRRHAAEARSARAAMSILNQGWANLTGMLQLAMVDERLAQEQMEQIAHQVEQHAVSRASHAYACEGLVPGVSEMVAEINYQARVLQQVYLIENIGMAEAESATAVARRVLDVIAELQRRIGEVSRVLVVS